jgi:hypothetical protein
MLSIDAAVPIPRNPPKLMTASNVPGNLVVHQMIDFGDLTAGMEETRAAPVTR